MEIFLHLLFTTILSIYLITNLQWYNYKLDRVVLKHHKISWHILYFVLPIIFYYGLYFNRLILIGFLGLYSLFFILWYKKLDKKLVLTYRVKRYFGIFFFVLIAYELLCFASSSCSIYGIFLPLLITILVSNTIEKLIFIRYKGLAKDRLNSMNNLKIIAITASFGKTSMKNYLYQILEDKFRVYMTPRSVNTVAGIVKDINSNMPSNLDFYIVEAGARERGDILDITSLIEPHYSIIGKVGAQHIEYFKTLDNIINTKMEILQSRKLIKGFVDSSVPILEYDTIVKYPQDLKVIESNLSGVKFQFLINGELEVFETPILGSFNALNLVPLILLSLELGLELNYIKDRVSKLKSVDNRLKKIESSGKIILDDSFNGNLDGILEAINISSTYSGRKVIITPGVIESTKDINIDLAKRVNEVFDLVVITGSLNREIFKDFIDSNKLIILKDKSKMQDLLVEHTFKEDLILFANDAPNFI